MSHLHYPSVKEYRLPRKNILVISCIDLRFADEIMKFLHFDNLGNRFDHFKLAGTAVSTGATREEQVKLFNEGALEKFDSFKHWKRSLYEHIQLAITLHQIKDIYIIEHQDCGAYGAFLKDGNFDSWEEEVKCHKKFAVALSEEIRETEFEPNDWELNVHCFIIDIRGNVELLHTSGEHYA